MTETIQGLDKLQRKLKTLENFQRYLSDPMEESLSLLHDDIATRPRKAAGAFSRLATDKQRRAYWARVRGGEIGHGPHGYKRTGTMSRGWTTKVMRTGNGLRGQLGNAKASPWGVYVQGNRQQPFHKESGWRTVDAVRDDNWPKIKRKFERAIDKELNK